MNPEIPLAYLHFVALIGTASVLVTELVLCRPGLQGHELHRLRRIDGAYAAFAVAALVTGAMRLFWGAKGSAYYLANPVFHAKFGLFVAIGLLSIWPTVRFISWSKAARHKTEFVPDAAALARVRMLLRVQVLLLAALPLLAAMMARGITSFHR
jgi:putative membrane protein